MDILTLRHWLATEEIHQEVKSRMAGYMAGERQTREDYAISRAGYFLVALDKYSQRLIEEGPKHPSLGPGSVHASIGKGGMELSSYPATCSIQLERRTVLDEPVDRLTADVDELLKTSTQDSPALSYESKTILLCPTFEIAPDHPFVSLVADQIKQTTGNEAKMRVEASWTDAFLLADKDIPVVMYGQAGESPSPQAPEEGWVDLQSLTTVAETLNGISQAFCGEQRRMRQ